jgi:hypothetical protein
MSTPILKSYVDERGNISVRVSRDVTVLTQEEADLIEAEYKRMQADNAKLRELVDGLTWCSEHHCRQECPLYDVSEPDHCREVSIKRELGIEVG